MPERYARGTWVEIHAVVLAPGERATQLPDDTRAVPLEMRVKGFMQHEAGLGEHVEIRTPAGRRLRGTLSRVDPGYDHGFGPPVPALLDIAEEARALLAADGDEP